MADASIPVDLFNPGQVFACLGFMEAAELLLEGAKFADANGFCAVWTPERHFHAFGGPYPNPSVTGAAVAHDGHSHGAQKLMGTVKAVHAEMNHVEITGKDGKTEAFTVNAGTKYLKGDTVLALADLKPGTRVVVETKMDGETVVATVVRIGGAPKDAPKAGTHQH